MLFTIAPEYEAGEAVNLVFEKDVKDSPSMGLLKT